MPELEKMREQVKEHYHIGMSVQHRLPARVNFPAFEAWLESERTDAVRNAFALQERMNSQEPK